tara:strand:- start:1155 stop:1490 length:336 start_codon:yes stop_codon:yes gene_type:complete
MNQILQHFMKFLFIILIFSVQNVQAVEIDETVSDEEKAAFETIFEPIIKIYHFIMYAASISAVIGLIICGFVVILSGNDITKRQNAKVWMGCILFGLIIILGAQPAVNLIM